MDEFELIRRFFTQAEVGPGVSIGVGDDGAVVVPQAGRSLVVVVDTLVAGVHYPLDFPAADVGYRALAVNLSDVAAMGGTPRWMTLALTLTEADETWLTDFAGGLFEGASEYGVALIGGDTTRGIQTVVSVQLLGDVRPEAILTRAGAAPGDGIYVTGTVGDAAGGLALLQDASRRKTADAAACLVRRFSRPAPRVAVGAAIAGFATAAIDLSDGLGTDLVKLLQASRVAGTIDLARLPLSVPLRATFADAQALSFGLDGGDDYELCFTVRPADHARLMNLATQLGVAITQIGELREGAGLDCRKDGRTVPYRDRGYRHF